VGRAAEAGGREWAQDVSFIEADPSQSSKPLGEEARTYRCRDGVWARRKTGSVYG